MDLTYREQQEAQRKEREAKMKERKDAVRTGLKAAVEALGLAWKDESGTLVDGVSLRLTIQEEHSGSYSFRRGTGRLRVSFGDYGNVRQFPEPKAGFDFPKLAGAIRDFVASEKRRTETAGKLETATLAARNTATAINADLGLQDYTGLRAEVDARTGTLRIIVPVTVDEAKARALLAAAKEILSR